MTPQAEWTDIWCLGCCTQHDKHAECPGELLATGPERHGWRVLADTPRGPEVFGTLVAPAGERWRARILTYPNVLWIIRGGHTMKFLGSTPKQAENAAIAYIREHCKRRSFPTRTEVPSVESGAVDREEDASVAGSEAVEASQRQLRAVRVRYGLDRPTEAAETDDLSEGGLFIRTDEPMPIGTNLHLRLEADGFGIPLKGIVRWLREEEEDGRPRGMGIRLVAPHPRYLHYIRQQRNSSRKPAEASTYEVEEWSDGSATEVEPWQPADPASGTPGRPPRGN